MIKTLLWCAIGYVLGSLPFGVWFTKWAQASDPRSAGSGNIGATNVWRLAGWRLGLAVYLADIAKGMAAVLLAPPEMRWMAGFCAIMGHVFSCFVGFRGGKGVATASGVCLLLLPVPTLMALIAWSLIARSTRYISLASLCAAVTLSLGTWCFDTHTAGLWASILCALVCYTHRDNMVRLWQGQEHRI